MNQKGSVLLFTIMITIVVFTLTLSSLSIYIISTQSTQDYIQNQDSRQAAEAGIENALSYVRQFPNAGQRLFDRFGSYLIDGNYNSIPYQVDLSQFDTNRIIISTGGAGNQDRVTVRLSPTLEVISYDHAYINQ